MIIDNAGTYTLRYTATDDCGKTTTVDRELVVQDLPYGVYWDGSESSAWTRIGKSASFEEPIPQYSDGNGGWIGGSSPFDNLMPWSGMQIVEDATVGTLVSIPKFYYKWTHGLGENGNGLQLEISDKPLDGFFTSPAHADRGDGVGERDVVYVGRYHCSNSDYKSTSGATPMVSKARSSFRGSISALGNDVWQQDFAMFWTIRMLYLVEFADWNSQAKIGVGCGSLTSASTEGRTDSMTYHTGTNKSALTTFGDVQYRHIEGLWSNVEEFVDGIYFNGLNAYVINNPSNFSDTINGTHIGEKHSADGVAYEFIDPSAISGFEYSLFPSDGVQDGTYSIYLCDEYLGATTGVVMACGGSFKNKGQKYGLFDITGAIGVSNTYNSVGSRLMKLPNA